MASPVRPEASSRVACCCQLSCWRRTSVISAPPWRSWIARNAAPASTACSCCGSPTSTTLAPASAAWESTRSICRVPTMPASSMTSTSREVSRSRPCDQPCSRLAIVREPMPEPFSRPSAAIPDKVAPRTLRPALSQARALHGARRPAYLLSGLLECGACGGVYAIVVGDRYGCAGHHRGRSCTDGRTIRREELERRDHRSARVGGQDQGGGCGLYGAHQPREPRATY